MILTNLYAIFRKEFQSYFASPFAYIIAAVFWLIGGFFFSAILEEILQTLSFFEQSGQLSVPVDVAGQFIDSFFAVIISLLLV